MSILTLGYDQNTMICHAVSTLKPKVSKTNLKEKNKEKKIKWKKKNERKHKDQQDHALWEGP